MSSRNSKQYKCLSFIMIFYSALFICHVLFQNKFILISLGLLSLGSIFMGACDILNDIITEVYGFALSMRFFWSKTFVAILFNWFCYLMTNLSSPGFRQNKESYYFIFDHAPFIVFFGIAFYMIAYRLNAYLLIKWKILLKGRYFWLRSFGSTILCITIFGLLFTPLWFWFGIVTSGKEAIQLEISSFVFRIILYLILAFPSTVIVNILKIIEQVDVYDYGLKFNPFKNEKSSEN